MGMEMKSQILKLVLLSCVVFLASCDVTFKRKNSDADAIPVNMGTHKKNISKKTESKTAFNKKDSQIINSYYADNSNATIRKDMITHTELSKKQNNKLVTGNLIPRDVQVIPLPLKLERILSELPLQLLRVQVGEKVILMDVKSRNILDVIKI